MAIPIYMDILLAEMNFDLHVLNQLSFWLYLVSWIFFYSKQFSILSAVLWIIPTMHLAYVDNPSWLNASVDGLI